MAGHSQFANIKHRKDAQDRKRAKIFTKLTREIIETVARGKFFEPVLGVPACKAAVYIEVHEDLRTETIPKWPKKDLVQRSLLSKKWIA